MDGLLWIVWRAQLDLFVLHQQIILGHSQNQLIVMLLSKKWCDINIRTDAHLY